MAPGTGFFMKSPTFADNDYVSKYKLTEDNGRFTVTRKEADKYMWKVPTLRNIALTAPYFHNGAVGTLDEAVRVMARVQLNKELTNEQVMDMVAFLSALTGEFPEQPMPHLPPTPGRSIIK
jgi:cytochrome c peroxidase